MSGRQKVDKLTFEKEVLSLDKEIVENELYLFRYQLFNQLRGFGKKTEQVRIIKLFVKLFYYYLDESIASEENGLLKDELAISSLLIRKYEDEYEALMKEYSTLLKKFNIMSTVKKGVERDNENLKNENFKLKQLERKYSAKVQEEFQQKLLQFKLEEMSFFNNLVESENSLFKDFCEKMNKSLDINYFFRFLFKVKKMYYLFKIMVGDLAKKQQPESVFYLGYFLYLLKYFELNVGKDEFVAKLLKNPVNMEIFEKLVEEAEEMFSLFKQRKVKINTSQYRHFYKSLSSIYSVLYPAEKGELKNAVITYSCLTNLVNSINAMKLSFSYDKADSLNSFKNILNLFVFSLSKTEKKSKYFVLDAHRVLLPLIRYVDERRKEKIINNDTNNKLFNLLYKVKQAKFKMFVMKKPDQEMVTFCKAYEKMVEDNKSIVGLKVSLNDKDKDLHTMNRIVTNYRIEKKELQKQLDAARFEVEKRKKKDEEQIRVLENEKAQLMHKMEELDEKREQKLLFLRQEIEKLELKALENQKLRRRLKKLEKRKGPLTQDSLSQMNMSQNVYLNLEKQFSWIHHKIEKKEGELEVNWLKNLKTTRVDHLQELNKIKQKISNWKLTEKNIQLEKKIVDFSDSGTTYDQKVEALKQQKTKNKNRLRELKEEVYFFKIE